MEDIPPLFTAQVQNYLRYRPRYPSALVELLQRDCHLTQNHVIADIGSGTGFLTELFLKNGNPVFGIEPNPDMRAGGDHYLHMYPHFTSLAASAEMTGLADQSVDFVTVGQAFHWFPLEATKREFIRILAPHGWVVLVWNLQRSRTSPFQIALEQFWEKHLTRQGAWEQHFQRIREELITPFYQPGVFKEQVFDNSVECDWEGLRGRVFSTCSKHLALQDGDRHYPYIRDELQEIFEKHQVNGKVKIEQATWAVYGQLCEIRTD